MGDVKAFVTKWCAGHDSGTLGPKIRADLESILAAERAAATAACAAHVEEHISRAVGRAWIAEEIRALSPEGWVGVRREDAELAVSGLLLMSAKWEFCEEEPLPIAAKAAEDAADRIRAALDASKEG